ncbi:MAG: DUF4824 family protein, partial [Gammaproteobacteria bacterium]|nr:DUF4824 family protein [Gammaproteobacteria bacterium]
MRKLILASVSLLLLTNVVVLAGVAYNRSDEPLFSIELTERELPIRQSFSSTDENSGTALSLDWQIFDPDEDPNYFSNTYTTPTWLDDKKLTALGFDIKELKSNIKKYRYRTSHLSVEAVVVLEYQGEAYHKTLALAESKAERLRKRAADFPDDEVELNKLNNFKKQLSRLKISQSRLYAVDAGLDKQALMQKYADQSRYLFARGEIGLRWKKEDVEGRIRQLYIQKIHASLPFSNILSGLTPGDAYNSYSAEPVPPRYKVQLNIGKRLEPWIASVTQME